MEEKKSGFKRLLYLMAGAVILGIVALLVFVYRSKATLVVAPPQPPPVVEVTKVDQQNVPIYSEWVGALDGMVNAEIRAQVTGYLLKQDYREGSFVKKGQLLFEIDPRPLQSVLEQNKADLGKAKAQLAQAESQLLQARAQLAQAEAALGKTKLDVDRLAPLAREKAVTDQEVDNAAQANLAARAQVNAANAGVETAKSAIEAARASVSAAEASVRTAELNLGFTRIYSPIDGIAGIAQAQVGNLIQVSNPNAGPLTTVSTVNPIKAYFTLSEQEYLKYSKLSTIQSKWGGGAQKLVLELILADGATYPQHGRFFIADRQVDQKTGAIRMAGLFPNPGNTLRPGQYGRVRAVTGERAQALVVPQRAVIEMQGSYRVAVVDNGNRVNLRPVKVGARSGPLWIIEEGLSQGERVIVEGTQKVRQDSVVDPKPFITPVGTAVKGF